MSEKSEPTTTNPNPAASDPAPAEPAAPANPAPAAPGRPEGLPESFWDTEKNEIKLTDLVSDYGNLSKFKAETEERFKERPESPDKYEFRVPEGFEMPEGLEFKLDPDSDLLKVARQVAFDSGRGQAGFDEMVSHFMKNEIARVQAEETAAEETFQTEMKKLGERSNERIESTKSYLQKNLSADQFKAIEMIATTAAGVEAIEVLMGLSKDSAPKVPGASPSGISVSEADLSAMMDDPRYYRDRDPEFVQKVADGFRKLYPGNYQKNL
jgi:hypothetical protein